MGRLKFFEVKGLIIFSQIIEEKSFNGEEVDPQRPPATPLQSTDAGKNERIRSEIFTGTSLIIIILCSFPPKYTFCLFRRNYDSEKIHSEV